MKTMMKMKIKDKFIIILYIFLFMLNSCECKSVLCFLQEVDKQCNDMKINNIFVAFRSQEWFSSTSCLMVSTFSGNKPPYVIKYDSSKDSVCSISNNLLVLNKTTDYLTKRQIIEAVKLYEQLQVVALGIDERHNIYIKRDNKTWAKVKDKEKLVGKIKRGIYSNWYEIE